MSRPPLELAFGAVPETLDALATGEIPAAHGKQIAKAAAQGR